MRLIYEGESVGIKGRKEALGEREGKGRGRKGREGKGREGKEG